MKKRFWNFLSRKIFWDGLSDEILDEMMGVERKLKKKGFFFFCLSNLSDSLGLLVYIPCGPIFSLCFVFLANCGFYRVCDYLAEN